MGIFVDVAVFLMLGGFSLLMALWVGGALFFDAGKAGVVGWILLIAWSAAVIALFIFLTPIWKPFSVVAVLFLVALYLWRIQAPSNDRQWDPNYARPPRAILDGDLLTICDVRNTEYISNVENRPHFETRSYQLSELQGVDVLILYWGSQWMCHPMFIFNFGRHGRLCISIEVRYRVGQKYDLLKSLYRQQEIIYIASDERDSIMKRLQFPNHDMYLYRLNTNQIVERQFLFEYLTRMNRLVNKPQWYHGLTANCTTSIYQQGRGRINWDYRMLLNGALDKLMYQRDTIHSSLPFEELKRKSWINDIALEAPEDEFGDYLRQHLPGYDSGQEKE